MWRRKEKLTIDERTSINEKVKWNNENIEAMKSLDLFPARTFNALIHTYTHAHACRKRGALNVCFESHKHNIIHPSKNGIQLTFCRNAKVHAAEQTKIWRKRKKTSKKITKQNLKKTHTQHSAHVDLTLKSSVTIVSFSDANVSATEHRNKRKLTKSSNFKWNEKPKTQKKNTKERDVDLVKKSTVCRMSQTSKLNNNKRRLELKCTKRKCDLTRMRCAQAYRCRSLVDVRTCIANRQAAHVCFDCEIRNRSNHSTKNIIQTAGKTICSFMRSHDTHIAIRFVIAVGLSEVRNAVVLNAKLFQMKWKKKKWKKRVNCRVALSVKKVKIK